MDRHELSERILNSNFGIEIAHAEEDANESPPSDEAVRSIADDPNSLSHYGVLGMKWGVRKDRDKKARKNRDKKYEGETNAEYSARMQREFTERQSKQRAKEAARDQKEAAATQKRALKSQEKLQKQQLKAQIKQQENQLAAQEREREAQRKQKEKELTSMGKSSDKKSRKGTNENSVKTMTDQELNDAITRLRKEAEYKQLIKKPDGLLKKTVKTTASIGGGILIQTGKNIAVRQLSDIGNQKADEYLSKKGYKKSTASSNKDNRVDDILDALKKAGLM